MEAVTLLVFLMTVYLALLQVFSAGHSVWLCYKEPWAAERLQPAMLQCTVAAFQPLLLQL